jgi:two-component system, chemotaxis family, protein-glutamate methylesterase/glutaminase
MACIAALVGCIQVCFMAADDHGERLGFRPGFRPEFRLMSPSAGHPQVTVLIADDSAFMRTSLTRMIESDEGLSVIGTAQTGLEALAKINSLQPDVVTLDIDMPGMDGLQTLKRVMSDKPRPIIIVSSLARGGAEATIEALALGAFDCIAKSLSYGSDDVLKVQNELISKIKAAAAAGISAARLPQSSNAPLHLAAAAGHHGDAQAGEVHSGELRAGEVQARNLQAPEVVAEQALVQHAPVRGVPAKRSAATTAQVPSIIAIGTSTGGPKALQEILSALPGNLSVPIIIVQHMPLGFTGPFAKRLDALCALEVHEAANGELVESGHVYVAPAGKHLTVRRRNVSEVTVCLSLLPRNVLHIPSVDVMMSSVAEVFHGSAMGIILTGMGGDGAQGMQAIFRAGGRTLGQDQASCVVYGMPRSCEELGVLSEVVALADIPRRILAAVRYKPN